MKVLIIDDETHVREGIKLLANWDEINTTEIFEAENGRIAKDIIISERPQIIFTDMMMPELDGRELLKWIKSEKLTSKIIVVTGYEDYQFMREAIQNGASDYLLKPIDPDTLNETIMKVVEEWKKEDQQRIESIKHTRKLDEILPFYRDQQLSNAIFSNEYDEKLLPDVEKTAITSVHISVIKLRNLKAFIGIWSEELCYFAILNVVNEILQNKNVGIAFRNIHAKQEVCIIYWGENIENFNKYLSDIVMTVVPFPFHISSSGQYEVDKLHEAYLEAKQIIHEYNLLEMIECPVYLRANIQEQKGLNAIELLKLLDKMMDKNDISFFDEIINRIVNHLKEWNYFSYAQLENWHQEFELFINRWIMKNSVQTFHKISIDAYWDIQGHFELNDFFLAQRERVSSLLHQKGQPAKELNTIEEIAYYIQNHYSEEISLQEFSEKFYLSREYISRKFKQIYGENLSDYIVRIRMNKAKELLKFPRLKIYEIAGEIGYQDDKYFRKIFKKMVGMTPNEYRKEFEVKEREQF